MEADAWLPCDARLTSHQKLTLRHLRRLLGASRLPHLQRSRCSAVLLDDGHLAITIRHDREPDVDVVVYAAGDGRAEVWCDALGALAHWDFDRRENHEAIEAVALVLHGWASSVVIFEGDELLSVQERIEHPSEPRDDDVDDATLAKIYGRPIRIERRSVTWASTKTPRVMPPARERWLAGQQV
jgi:hypothetical protein